MLSRNAARPVQVARQPLIENLIGQGALSRAGHAGNAGHNPERYVHIDVFQVVLPCAFDRQKSRRYSALIRYRDLDSAA